MEKSFWHLPDSQVGGGTTCLYKIYSLGRISYYKPPSLSSFPQLSSENVGRVVNEKDSGGITTDTSVLNDVSTILHLLIYFRSPHLVLYSK